MRISSWFARASHLPDPLIQRIPSNLIDVSPLLACTSKGSFPTRAESSRRKASSLSSRKGTRFGWVWFFKILRFFGDRAPKKWPCGQLIHQTEHV
jgi:hypothetical protein